MTDSPATNQEMSQLSDSDNYEDIEIENNNRREEKVGEGGLRLLTSLHMTKSQSLEKQRDMAKILEQRLLLSKI